MRISTYFLLTIASLAFQTYSLPTGSSSEVSKRDAVPAPEIIERETRHFYHGPPTPPTTPADEEVPIVALNHEAKRAEVSTEPIPVAGSDYNKREASSGETEEIEKRATTMDPTVGISQDLPSGIVMFMIIFMLYAMITAISMKDAD
ncbi:hypothetical protein ABW19_dt0209446 [Dactylella cylindrospora]|nr:hypothetical protein ABW19_dt0209446 [Dactylella cylindrospora]